MRFKCVLYCKEANGCFVYVLPLMTYSKVLVLLLPLAHEIFTLSCLPFTLKQVKYVFRKGFTTVQAVQF